MVDAAADECAERSSAGEQKDDAINSLGIARPIRVDGNECTYLRPEQPAKLWPFAQVIPVVTVTAIAKPFSHHFEKGVWIFRRRR